MLIIVILVCVYDYTETRRAEHVLRNENQMVVRLSERYGNRASCIGTHSVPPKVRGLGVRNTIIILSNIPINIADDDDECDCDDDDDDEDSNRTGECNTKRCGKAFSCSKFYYIMLSECFK